MSTTIYSHAIVFTADGTHGAEDTATADAFAVTDGLFIAVGTLEDVRAAVTASARGAVTEADLGGRFVMPGVIDSHTHLDSFGTSLDGVQLRDCSSLPDIQAALVQWLDRHPDADRVVGGGWLFDAVGDTHPTAAMIDEVLPDIPVYLDANDVHSTWVNTAALAEAGVDDDTPDPVGGRIARDSNGKATGMLYETAGRIHGREFVDGLLTDDDHVRAVESAFAAYLAAGVTGATDMALTKIEVTALRSILARDGRLPFPITGHVLMVAHDDPAENLAQIGRAAALRDELAASGEDTWFRIAGVKFIMDGVIDACTATMCHPYANGTNADPIWDSERILPAAAAADAAGLQIAMHAIGDRTSEIALDALEYCAQQNGVRQSARHRVEHLETVTDGTIARMATLGVTASMQPVHSDPAIMDNWKAVLGDERQEQGFPWHKFRQSGVPLTLGTDAPTAPHEALGNLYIALTGGSSLQPELPPYHPERAFSPAEALTALTAGAAYAGHMDSTTGRIRPGLQANFIELDINPLQADPRALLDAQVMTTRVLGETAYKRN